MLHFSTLHKLGILQGFVVEQPVQLCPLRRGVAVLVLDGDAVDGKGGAILELSFHCLGVSAQFPQYKKLSTCFFTDAQLCCTYF